MSFAEVQKREPYILCYTKVNPERGQDAIARPRSKSVPALD